MSNYIFKTEYILDHRESYYDILQEFGEYVRANQPDSLAQQNNSHHEKTA